MQYTVKKPINNNILRVVDSTGCELIVTGRGLGFGVKPGYKIGAETVECSYRMTSPAVQQKLVELLERIPYEHLLLTDELVETIRQRLKYPLNESLLITLADHISFAIQRSEQGILPGRVSPWHGVPCHHPPAFPCRPFGRRGRLHCVAHRQRRAQHHHERGERCHPLCGWLRAGSRMLLQLPF